MSSYLPRTSLQTAARGAAGGFKVRRGRHAQEGWSNSGPEGTSFIDMLLKEMANHHGSLSPIRAACDGQAIRRRTAPQSPAVIYPQDKIFFPKS